MMKFALTFAIAVFVLPKTSTAICLEPVATQAEILESWYNISNVVFVGKLQNLRNTRQGSVQAEYIVTRAVKGVKDGQLVKVITSIDPSDLPLLLPFDKKEEWVVYGVLDIHKEIRSSECSPTKSVKFAEKELEYFSKLGK